MCAWWPPCARIPPRSAEFTTRYGGRGYTSAAGLLADPAVDAVVIATPHHLHTAAVEAAAQAGKHILLEKPMAPTLAECDRILAATAAAWYYTPCLGSTSQFALAYRLAKTMLDAGELGTVVFGVSTMSKFWFKLNRRAWHPDFVTGGGIVADGWHSLPPPADVAGGQPRRPCQRTVGRLLPRSGAGG